MWGAISRSLAVIFVILTVGLFSSPTQAAVTWDYNVSVAGKLAGASGVVVGSVTYNVTFVDGMCAAVFSGCDNAASDFQFTLGASATAAADALRDQVFLDTGINGSPADFDSDPSLTVGCSSARNCSSFIPHTLLLGDVVVNGFNNWGVVVAGSDTNFFNSAFTLPFSTDGAEIFDTQRTWAVFNNPAVVPLPAALPLFLSGLAIFGFVARKMQSAAD